MVRINKNDLVFHVWLFTKLTGIHKSKTSKTILNSRIWWSLDDQDPTNNSTVWTGCKKFWSVNGRPVERDYLLGEKEHRPQETILVQKMIHTKIKNQGSTAHLSILASIYRLLVLVIRRLRHTPIDSHDVLLFCRKPNYNAGHENDTDLK